MKELVEQAIAMIHARPKEEIEIIYHFLMMDNDIQQDFILAYRLKKETTADKKAYMDYKDDFVKLEDKV